MSHHSGHMPISPILEKKKQKVYSKSAYENKTASHSRVSFVLLGASQSLAPLNMEQ